jgi:hypothetical protein
MSKHGGPHSTAQTQAVPAVIPATQQQHDVITQQAGL